MYIYGFNSDYQIENIDNLSINAYLYENNLYYGRPIVINSSWIKDYMEINLLGALFNSKPRIINAMEIEKKLDVYEKVFIMSRKKWNGVEIVDDEPYNSDDDSVQLFDSEDPMMSMNYVANCDENYNDYDNKNEDDGNNNNNDNKNNNYSNDKNNDNDNNNDNDGDENIIVRTPDFNKIYDLNFDFDEFCDNISTDSRDEHNELKSDGMSRKYLYDSTRKRRWDDVIDQ